MRNVSFVSGLVLSMAPKAPVELEKAPGMALVLSQFECQDPDLNWGHGDFQSPALPTELSRPVAGATRRS